MIGWMLASGTVRADDAFAVAPFGDAVAVATVWREQPEVWFVGPEGVRLHQVLGDGPLPTNPAVACDARACFVAWVAPPPGGGTLPIAWVARLDAQGGGPPYPTELGRGTRVHLVPADGGGVDVVLEAPSGARNRTATRRAVSADGSVGPVSAAFGGATFPAYGLHRWPDGTWRWTSAGARPTTWRWDGDAAVEEPLPVPLDVLGCVTRGPAPCALEADVVAGGDGGARAWLTKEGGAVAGRLAADGTVAWRVPLESLSPGRASWVRATVLFPLFRGPVDGLAPFHVPIHETSVHGGSVTLALEGPVAGRATATSPERSRIDAIGPAVEGPDLAAALGEAWIVVAGDESARYPKVTASWDASAFSAPSSACGRVVSVTLGESENLLVVEFERGTESFRAEGPGLGTSWPTGDETAIGTWSGPWDQPCVDRQARATVRLVTASSTAPLVPPIRTEIAHQGLRIGF